MILYKPLAELNKQIDVISFCRVNADNFPVNCKKNWMNWTVNNELIAVKTSLVSMLLNRNMTNVILTVGKIVMQKSSSYDIELQKYKNCLDIVLL